MMMMMLVVVVVVVMMMMMTMMKISGITVSLALASQVCTSLMLLF
jgi:hypothetical protein